MASTYIRPASQTNHAQRLISVVDGLNSNIASMRVLYAAMTSMKDGTDFTILEGWFGLSAGQGATVYNYVKESLDLIDALDAGLPNKLQRLLQRLG
jgi:hypothetical protein